MSPEDALSLADYRRSVASIYTDIRAAGTPAEAHTEWVRRRDRLFASHPQSAIPEADRSHFEGLAYWPYDPDARVLGEVHPTADLAVEIPNSASGSTRFERVGRVEFRLRGAACALDLFWLDAYGGGLFLPFRDASNGSETYGGGRYLLDTVKGADLGAIDGRLILDFNFAYHPSCVHSPVWSCPLAPAGNHLDIAVTAGERLPS